MNISNSYSQLLLPSDLDDNPSLSEKRSHSLPISRVEKCLWPQLLSPTSDIHL